MSLFDQFWKFLMLTGPLYFIAIASLIGKVIGIPWMNWFVFNTDFLFPIGTILFIYEALTSIISVKESLKDKHSGLHTIPFRRVWAPALVVIAFLTSSILFLVSYHEARIDVFPDAVIWFPSGWIWLYYMVGLMGPIPKNMVFNPTILKKFLSSKYDD